MHLLGEMGDKLRARIGVVHFHQMLLRADKVPAAPWTKSQQEVGADWSASAPRRSAFGPILGPGIGLRNEFSCEFRQIAKTVMLL